MSALIKVCIYYPKGVIALSPERKYSLFISALSLQMAHDTNVLSRESFSCQAARFFTSFPDSDNLPPPHMLFPLPSPHSVGAKPVFSSPA